VKKIFKLVLARSLDLKPSLTEIHTVGHPLLEFTTWKLVGDHVAEQKREKNDKEGGTATTSKA
jgi:hypothetical protein